ncbi:dioxygenase [Salinarimonas sp.]|uniref:dioxygenase family protein n=1 Tax=Salinarimonas sp. TaxID=2766526 RepID=UPI0032D96023
MADRPTTAAIEEPPARTGRRAAEGVERLEDALGVIAAHLHAAVREAAPTRAELLAAASFLAETGRISDARRQEFVLLSDVLGVSALVEAINARRPADATPNTLRDPFYVPDAPERAGGADIRLAGTGAPLSVSLRVVDLAGAGVAGARVETWQANGEGVSDLQDPDGQPEHNLRGVFRTDAEGRVSFRTIRPGCYRVPVDGPVGALLARLGRSAVTPAHLNFRVSARGYETLTTQIFDAADPALAADAIFAVRAGLAAPFARAGEGWSVALTFALAPLAAGDAP